MSKILTVVITAYNIEKYIRQCLDSFINHSNMADFEVLIVNDGSKDTTSEIAHEYSAKYPDTFITVDKENGGHGSTINKGIEIARGKYFKVVDGDDWVDVEAYAKLVDFLKTAEADVVTNNFMFVNEDTNNKTARKYKGVKYNYTYNFDDVGKERFVALHNMNIKTCILRDNHIKISENVFYDDMEYVLYPIPYIDSIIYTNLNVYMYRIGNVGQSVSMVGRQKHIQGHESIVKKLCVYLNQYESLPHSEIKACYIANRIAGMASDHYATYLSFKSNDTTKMHDFEEFDKYIKSVNPQVNKLVEQYKTVTFVRRRKFKNYRWWHFIYNLMMKINRIKRGEVFCIQ